MTFHLMDALFHSPFQLGGNRNVLPMRLSGLYSAMFAYRFVKILMIFIKCSGFGFVGSHWLPLTSK